jgi:MoaA/NifB/PqqE/SkfB family radical SAM enzyme
MPQSFFRQRIRRLHLELTEKCNAACPLCLRTNPNGLTAQSYIGTRELRLDCLQKSLPLAFREDLIDVHMCGSYGDPIIARDCLEIADLLCTNFCAISLSTNGGARSAKWWSELGKILNRNPRSRVDFHIDGLADTNSFYRRNTQFSKIMDNANAFIEAGGQANWEFIPFKHNEHQVEKIRELSQKMNFSRFTIKKSNWMFSKDRPAISFTDEKDNTLYLEAPSSQYKPDKSRSRVSVLPDSGKKGIQCLALFNKELYISCESIVYPCCWTARRAREIYLGRKTKDGFSTLFKEHDGRNTFDLKQHTLETMLQSVFFHKLSECWNTGSPPVCYKKCVLKDQPDKVKFLNVEI